jgi:hypothetical protein
MTDGDGASEEAFVLLSHEIRLDIIRAFFDEYDPPDPESASEARDRYALSYAELMSATGTEDSGKFNYHLKKLRGTYIEKAEGGYAPTASAVALYESVVANRPTESVEVGIEADEDCPSCGSGLQGRYEREFLTVECPECDLFWGITYRFPKNGVAVREGEGVYEAVYNRAMYHVGLARTGQCPSCAGITDTTVPEDRLDGESIPTVEVTCETCSWLATVDVVSALQFEPCVTRALLEVGVPLAESSGMRATERTLSEVSGRIDSEDPLQATVTIPSDDGVAEVVFEEGLSVRSVSVE